MSTIVSIWTDWVCYRVPNQLSGSEYDTCEWQWVWHVWVAVSMTCVSGSEYDTCEWQWVWHVWVAVSMTRVSGSEYDTCEWQWVWHVWVAVSMTRVSGSEYDTCEWQWVWHVWVAVSMTRVSGSEYDTCEWQWVWHVWAYNIRNRRWDLDWETNAINACTSSLSERPKSVTALNKPSATHSTCYLMPPKPNLIELSMVIQLYCYMWLVLIWSPSTQWIYAPGAPGRGGNPWNICNSLRAFFPHSKQRSNLGRATLLVWNQNFLRKLVCNASMVTIATLILSASAVSRDRIKW